MKHPLEKNAREAIRETYAQGRRIPQLNYFIGQMGLPPLALTGFCNGDAFIWARSKINGKDQQFKEDCEFVIGLSKTDIKQILQGHDAYFKAFLQAKQAGIADPVEQGAIAPELVQQHQDYLKLLTIYDNTLYFYQPKKAVSSFSQYDYDKAANLLVGAIQEQPDGTTTLDEDKAMQTEFQFTFHCDTKAIQDIVQACVHPNKICMVNSREHSTSLVYDGAQYHYFDPNDGHMVFDNLQDLSQAIVVALAPDDESSVIDFQVMDYMKNAPGVYPRYETLIQTIQADRDAPLSLKDDNDYTPAHLAAAHDNAELLDVLLAQGIEVDSIDLRIGSTPLMEACHRGAVNAVQLLLARGADVNFKPRLGELAVETPLSQTCSGTCSAEIVQLLIDHGATIDEVNRSEATALRVICAKEGQLDIAQMLLAHGADPSRRDIGGSTIILAATENPEFFEFFAKQDPDRLNEVNSINGSSVFHYAGASPQGRIIFEYLRKETDLPFEESIDKPNAKGQTPLHFAAILNRIENIKYLLEYGVDMHAQNENGETPLMICAKEGHIEAIKTFLEQEPNPDAHLNWVDFAAHNINTLQFLIHELDYDVTSVSPSGKSLLSAALEKEDNGEVIDYLLNFPNLLEHEPKDAPGEQNILFKAIAQKRTDIVNQLFELGWSANLKDAQGNNLLHYAILQKAGLDIVQRLIELGVDPYEKDDKDRNAYQASNDILVASNHLDRMTGMVQRYLKKRGFNEPRPEFTDKASSADTPRAASTQRTLRIKRTRENENENLENETADVPQSQAENKSKSRKITKS